MVDAPDFRSKLFGWHAGHDRPMPWKGVQDPYRIWLSEVILQQTRVAQGLPYYQRFVKRFPGVHELAKASDDEVFKLWEGLGYYRRARHMLETARHVAFERDGRFPDTYEGLLGLKGVGPYSAAAIASFAYGLPHAVVDGNVVRVLARIYGVDEAAGTSRGKKQFQKLAQELLDPARPGTFNQAIMDFGAALCKPKSPDCPSCPFRTQCKALREDRIHELPAKSKKPDRKKRYFHYLVLRLEEQVFIRQRRAADIWQNLYEFPLLEWPHAELSLSELKAQPEWKAWGWQEMPTLQSISPPRQQTLSHQIVQARFWEFELEGMPQTRPSDALLIDRKKLPTFAWPKVLDWYLTG